MTYGSHFAGVASTFQRRQGIEIKRKIARNYGSKINPTKEILLFIEANMRDP
jgi:hypothetical protein